MIHVSRSVGIISRVVEGQTPRTLLSTSFMLIVMLGGFLIFIYICGALFMISKCENDEIEKFDAKINQLKYVLSYHRVPVSMQERAIEFLEVRSSLLQVCTRMRLIK